MVMLMAMKIETLKNEITSLCKDISNLITVNMKDEGLTCEQSQRICLLNALKNFEQTVAGIDVSDIKTYNSIRNKRLGSFLKYP